MLTLFGTLLYEYAPEETIYAKRFNNMIVIDNHFKGHGLYYLRGAEKNFTLPSNLQRAAMNMELCPFKYSVTYDNYTRCLAEFAELPEVEVVFGTEVHKVSITENVTALQNVNFEHKGQHVHAEADF